MRPTWCDIDLDAVRHNVGVLDALAGEAALCAVVKADGYRHGAVPVARAAVEAGASWLAVALVEEAAELRAAGLDAPILMLSEPQAGDMPGVAELGGVRPTVYSEAGIDAFAAAAPGASVHLKVDTGMHRVGAAPADATDLARRALGAGLVLEGVFTHFAVADAPADPFTGVQIGRFDAVLAELAEHGVHPELVHLANTAGLITSPGARRSLVRAGIGIYGVSPSPELAAACAGLGLRPAARLRSEVRHVHVVEAGEGVSYGRRWRAGEPTRLATVPIGYADGITRAWWDGGSVLVGGRRRPIRGVVTMDQLVVEVDGDVAIGDEVVLLGSQGDESISAEEVAASLDTITYEVLVSLGARVPRRH
ncbi:MAG: alanine racemase [Acidimicrobiales bacterium]|jgi:alanine racemase|nr:alanine racemase [Acidimicrobiaceae bacterium]MDP6493640.1 alanine racemase [Acidimicrobiales bacterium]MDP6649965.1 alanine racemase [Acidimicrobiales bacterium]MDP6758986.1 alanine racemase [Acidimicrobiales bacterium]|tara:strand:+ start:19640 stop:20734 length:1095 start_codon:yes stop_codon:yes gene_type:complete